MQKLRAQRPHLLRVFKTRPELGIVFCDTPATAGAPPGPAHQSATALQTSSHDTPPPGAFPGVSSLPLVALDPHCRPVPRTARLVMPDKQAGHPPAQTAGSWVTKLGVCGRVRSSSVAKKNR